MIFLPLGICRFVTMSSLTRRSVGHFISLFHPSPPYHVLFLRLSSSTSQTSSSSHAQGTLYRRQQEEESRSVRVSIWWDFENCAVPAGANVFKVAHYVTTAVRSCGIKGPVQITAFGDVLHLPRANQEALSATGINLTHVPRGGKNTADRSLLVDLMYWVSQNPPPAHLFLISGDKDFAVILHRLRMNNYNILLACQEGTPNVLCSASSIMWHWNALVRGENLVGRYFNQPPDGPFHSWYGHYKFALEDPYALNEAPNSQLAAADEASSDSVIGPDTKPHPPPKDIISKIQGVVNSHPDGIGMPHPPPKDIISKIQGVVNSHPDGIGISELHAELSKNNVVFDNEYYGHKKFSHLLLSMPHVCKLGRHRGQFFASPVSAQVSETVECTAGENQEPASSSLTRNEGHYVSSARNMTPPLSSSVQITMNEVVADAPSTKAPASASSRDEERDSEKPVENGKDTENRDAAVNSGVKTETLPLNKVNNLMSPLSMFAKGSEQDKSGGKVHEEKKTGYSVIEDHNPAKEQCMKQFGEMIKDPATLANKQDSAHQLGFFQRLWNKWFGKKNVPPKKTEYEVSGKELDPTSIDKVSSSIEEKHSNLFTDSVGEPTSSSSGNNGSLNAKSNINDSCCINVSSQQSGTVLNPMNYSKKDELFLMDSFWSDIESYLNSENGSKVILNSMTREDIADNLRKEGPLVIQPLDECDLRKLVDLLISEKILIKECNSQTPPFRVCSHSSGNGTQVAQHPEKSSRLRSIFLGMSSESKSGAQPEEAYNMTKKKPSKLRSKSEVFADCEKLLDEMLEKTPEGINIGLFKTKFVQRYGYTLDYRKYGFKKLASLLQTISGVQVGTNYVVPTNFTTTAVGNTSSSSQLSEIVEDISKDSSTSCDEEEPLVSEENNNESESLWEELGPVESVDPAECQDPSLNSNRVGDGEYESPASDDDNADFSEFEEESLTTSTVAKDNLQTKKTTSRADDEVSSLLQILRVWGEKEKSWDETSQTGGSSGGSGDALIGIASNIRHVKNYNSFASNYVDKDNKLFDTKLGSLKKTQG